MKVLMFGWEFPPMYSGGLGTACYGLTKGLSKKGIQVTFVMPTCPKDAKAEYVKLLIADSLTPENVKVKKVESLLTPYITSETYDERLHAFLRKDHPGKVGKLYGRNMFEEAWRFSEKAKLIALSEEFDVIHAHDWLTFQAGIKAKEATSKPLVIHVHATEFDRGGGLGINDYVYKLEKEGMQKADKIIAVSNHTKKIIKNKYGIPENKVQVVHNAVDFPDTSNITIQKTDKIVLFLGRITIQKGPEFFIQAAKKVLEKEPDAKFVIAGSGDMEARMIHLAADLGIASKVLFAGFLTGEDVDRMYKMADVYIMPSVSEPFGITPLEAMRNNVPVIVSKTSGVSEVINHCLKVDFWDVNDIAAKTLALLKYRKLHGELTNHGSAEVKTFSWEVPAEKCINTYKEVLNW